MEPKRQLSTPVMMVISVVTAFTAAFLFQSFVLSTYHIPSESMAPTMMTGDAVLASGPLWDAIDPAPDLDRGDMIVFSDELGWLTGEPKSDAYLTKRVIGLPGDTIVHAEDGTLTINGEPYSEPYAFNPGPQSPYTVTVPEGKLWVLGDNRQNSYDSRRHHAENESGFVDVDSVEGTIKAVLPFHKLSPNPEG